MNLLEFMPLLLEFLCWCWKFSCVKAANNELSQFLLSWFLKAFQLIVDWFLQLGCLMKSSFLSKHLLLK